MAHSTYSSVYSGGLQSFQTSCPSLCILEMAPEFANGDLLYRWLSHDYTNCWISNSFQLLHASQDKFRKNMFSFLILYKKISLITIFSFLICLSFFFKIFLNQRNLTTAGQRRIDEKGHFDQLSSFSLPVLGQISLSKSLFSVSCCRRNTIQKSHDCTKTIMGMADIFQVQVHVVLLVLDFFMLMIQTGHRNRQMSNFLV